MQAVMLNRVNPRKDFILKPKPKRIVIPDYPIPFELSNIFSTELKIAGSAKSRAYKDYKNFLKALKNVECLDIAESHYFQLMKLSLYLQALQADMNIKNKTVTYISIDNDDERQNYPLRCAHYALELMSQQSTITYLFPHESKSFIENEVYDCSDSRTKFRNSDIAENAEQRQAIRNIINKSSFPAPYILYGPPGTGKTATLVEALCQIHDRNPLSHVLVCTPSNTAADEITKRLLKFLSSNSVYRMYSLSKEISAIDENILSCSNVENDKIV